MLQREILRKRCVRCPAAVLDLPLVGAQMLPDNVAGVVHKGVDLCAVLRLFRLEARKGFRQQLQDVGLAVVDDGVGQQALHFLTVGGAVREEFPEALKDQAQLGIDLRVVAEALPVKAVPDDVRRIGKLRIARVRFLGRGEEVGAVALVAPGLQRHRGHRVVLAADVVNARVLNGLAGRPRDAEEVGVHRVVLAALSHVGGQDVADCRRARKATDP